MDEIAEILDFWLGMVGPEGWYMAVPEVDQAIRDRFGPLWARIAAEDPRGLSGDWAASPEGALAYLILTDQFPRNMFRGDPRAFGTDPCACSAARVAIAAGLDLRISEPERVFFYMPFEHSEDPGDQDWAVALIEARMPEEGAGYLCHARAHREAIRRFGRFPFRNEALGRVTSTPEAEFLRDGGYRALAREFGG